VIYIAQRYAEAGETDRWMVLGLPLSLSLDNLVAGTTLGMLGFPMLISVVIIGAMSALFAVVGLRLGTTAVKLLPVRAELIGGVVLICIAISFVIDDLF
jgi:putative Mn2+ efflux pump MntP